MIEKKKFTLEEIQAMVPEDGGIEFWGKNKLLVAVRRISVDGVGSYLWKAFKLEEGGYSEIDLKSKIDEASTYLSKFIDSKKIIKEVIEKMTVGDFEDLSKRVKKKPKVTVGVQRGSCVYLYVKGLRGYPASLQLTE